MSESLKKIQKESQVQAKSRIDSRAEIIDPIDFSFKDLMNLEGNKQRLKLNTRFKNS